MGSVLYVGVADGAMVVGVADGGGASVVGGADGGTVVDVSCGGVGGVDIGAAVVLGVLVGYVGETVISAAVVYSIETLVRTVTPIFRLPIPLPCSVQFGRPSNDAMDDSNRLIPGTFPTAEEPLRRHSVNVCLVMGQPRIPCRSCHLLTARKCRSRQSIDLNVQVIALYEDDSALALLALMQSSYFEYLRGIQGIESMSINATVIALVEGIDQARYSSGHIGIY
jgi:hypothetical protein